MAISKTLNIILKLTKEGIGDQGAMKGLTGVQKAAKIAGAALAGFATVQAAKATFALAELGAQSIRTKNAFVAISGGADQARDRLEAMQRATRGALSEQQAMAAANRLMQMGLANNADELEKVSGMAVRLGAAMGKEAGPAIEEFSLMLANQSIPRLDTYGMSASRVRTRMKELAATFPEMDRQQRFMIATMAEGEEALGRLGDAAEDELLQFERLEASTADLQAAFGELIAGPMSDLVGVTNEAVEALQLLVTWNQQLEGVLATHGREVEKAAGTYDEYTTELTRAAEAAGYAVDEQGDLVKIIQQGDLSFGIAATYELVQADYMLAEAAFDAAQAVESKADRIAGALRRQEEGIEPAGDYSDAIAGIGEAAGGAAGSLYDLSTSAGTVAKSFGEMTFDDQTLWNLALASGASIEALVELAQHLGIATDAEIQATLETYGLIESFGSAEIEAEELADKYHATADAEMRIADQAIYASGEFETLTGGMQEGVEAADGLSGSMDGAAGSLLGASTAAGSLALALSRIEREVYVDIYIEEHGQRPTGEGAQRFQGGGTTPGGLAWVGEGGPELAWFPPGVRIYSAGESRHITNNRGGDTFVINDPLAAAMVMDERRRATASRLGREL